MISSLAAGLETVLRYGRIKGEHAWNGRPLYAREPEKACLHLPNPGVGNARTRQNAPGVWGAVRPRRAHSLWGSAKGRSCEPAQGRVSGPLRDHGAPVQRRAYPTAGQDRGHSSTAAPTSRQPADPNWQSQEDRSPAKETHAGLEPAASEAEALGGSRTALGTTGSGAKSRPDSSLLRLQEAVPLPVSSRRKWITIARRGLGLSERPAVRVAQLPTRRGGHVTLPLPARNRSKHVWSLWSEVSRRIRAALAAPVQLLPATRGSTPASLCLQTPCAT